MPDPSTFVVTTPIYYVNALPHIGSAYTTMVADAIARFHRLRGQQVLMVTGTDEHGQKIQRTAERLGIDPQVHCDQIAAEFQRLWVALTIQNDRFIRTTDAKHLQIVNEFFQRVWDQGDIYLGQQQGYYCVSCEEFKDKADLLDGDLCPIHTNQKVEWRDEANYFFKLSRYQAQLEALYAEQPQFIQPSSRRNEVLNFVKQGLRDFSISRVQVSWGIPMPIDPDHTIYVWFDALLSYVTALLDPDDEPTLENALKRWWPVHLHLIGKDILRFHAVYWPAMFMSAQVPLPERDFRQGLLTKDGQKMGKSLGNTLDPYQLIETYGADAVRYYFLKEIELGRDGDFNETRFKEVLNADLANDLGNLLNRTLTMLRKYRDYSIPAVEIPPDHPLKMIAESLPTKMTDLFDQLTISQAAQEIMALVQASNKYLDVEAPWTLYKQGQHRQVEIILYSVLEAVRIAAVLLSPLVPNLSLKILHQLGYEITDPGALTWEQTQWGYLSASQVPQPPQPVFQRLL